MFPYTWETGANMKIMVLKFFGPECSFFLSSVVFSVLYCGFLSFSIWFVHLCKTVSASCERCTRNLTMISSFRYSMLYSCPLFQQFIYNWRYMRITNSVKIPRRRVFFQVPCTLCVLFNRGIKIIPYETMHTINKRA